MNYWIFKCDPEEYLFDQRMADPEPATTWRVTRYADEIRAGDLAFIWKTGKERGVYAVMAIDENPKEREEYDHENNYNVTKDYGLKMRVCGRYVSRFVKIPSTVLKRIPELLELSVFHGFKQGTNFKVTPDEGRVLMASVRNAERRK